MPIDKEKVEEVRWFVGHSCPPEVADMFSTLTQEIERLEYYVQRAQSEHQRGRCVAADWALRGALEGRPLPRSRRRTRS